MNAVRSGPFWKDSIIFISYDEHADSTITPGHPSSAESGAQAGWYFSGQREDLSLPPFSEQPGGGAECSWNFVSSTDTTLLDAEALCPALTQNPTGPYPTSCAAFDAVGSAGTDDRPCHSSRNRLTFRTADHTSLLKLIENRFMPGSHLTKRDQYANDLESMFDFNNSPSLNTDMGSAQAPQSDCTP